MSLFFIVNNLHFALELLGALVFFVMAWLALDSYFVGKQTSVLFRIIGFSLVGVWQVVHSFGITADIGNYMGVFIYLVGLSAVILSFFLGPRIATAVSAVLVIPAFTTTGPYLELISAVALGLIAFLSFRQAKREYNASLKPFWLGFVFLSVAAFLLVFIGNNTDNIFWYVAHILEIFGFVSLSYWVWQYLKLRVRESMVIIFVSMTLFIATIVTLAFSTILISKIEAETKNNLLTNAKVFDFAIKGLSEESSAKAKLIAGDEDLGNLLSNDNFIGLENILSKHLDDNKLGFLLVADKNGTVVLRAHSLSERGDSIAGERAVEEALVGNNFTTIEFSSAEKMSVRSASPVYVKNKLIGVIVAGYQLDNALVDRIKKITGLDMTIYQDVSVVATTAFAGDGRSRLVGENISDSVIKENVISQGKTMTRSTRIRSEAFLASYLPLINKDGKIVGMLSAAQPQQEILDIANTTNRMTLITVTLILLILTFPIYILTRRLLEEE